MKNESHHRFERNIKHHLRIWNGNFHHPKQLTN